MSVLNSFLVGNANPSDFIELILSEDMTVPDDQPGINNPFEFDTIVRGSLPGFDTSLFKFVVPTDGFYSIQFTAITLGNDTNTGNRCQEILVDGVANAVGAIAELKLINNAATNIYSTNTSVFYAKDQELVFAIRQTFGSDRVYTKVGTYVSIIRVRRVS